MGSLAANDIVTIGKLDPWPGPAVYRLIAAVSADLAKVGIAKDRKNEQQGYKFRGIDEVMNALAPLLSSHGLVILPRMLTRAMTERQTRSGGVQFNVVVEAEFDFVAASDGTKHVVRVFGEAMDSADKATNKAMSAAYKYAAFQAFCIPLEGMGADTDTVTHEVVTGYSVQAPMPVSRDAEHEATQPSVPKVGDSGTSSALLSALSAGYAASMHGEELPPDGRLYIARVDLTDTKNKNVRKGLITFSDGRQASTIKSPLISLCEQLCQERAAVTMQTEDTKWGLNLLGVYRLDASRPAPEPMPTEDEIPF